jgi:hypothetical protein
VTAPEDIMEAMDRLSGYAPPDIPLRLTATGPRSRPQIVEYVRTVIEQRTTPTDDTTVERLAQGLVTSILHRLGAGYSIAVGSATVALVPVTDSATP